MALRLPGRSVKPGDDKPRVRETGGNVTTTKLDQPPKFWDRLFAPSSCRGVITTVDAAGHVHAAAFGTCTRVNHEPVYVAFTTILPSERALGHTADNVAVTGEFVVNLPAFDRRSLEQVRVVGLPF